MEKLKKEKKLNLKNVFLKIVLPIVILLAVVVISVFMNRVKREEQIALANGDMELLRAMSYEELTTQDELTDSDYVRFSAFFLRDIDLDGYANRIKGTCKEIGTSDTLYMSLAVLAEGTLTDGSIEIVGDNFYFQTALVEDEVIDGNYIDANTTYIGLKDVNVGTQKLIFGNVRSGNYSNGQTTAAIGNDTTKYSKVNKIIFKGVHVADDGTRTPIEKQIDIPVDWYSSVNAEIPSVYAGDKKNKYQSYGLENLIDETNRTITTTFKVVTQETKNKLNLSKSYIEAEIPQFNGYDPISVSVSGTNISYEYDAETRIVSAYREAVLNTNGLITMNAYSGQYSNARYNEYSITAVYPLEAYENLGINVINLVVPVKAYYEGYNNPNEEFDNPIRSTVAEDIINILYEYGGGDVVGFNVEVGTYVGNPYNAWVISKEKVDRAYNNLTTEDYEFEEDRYTVLWQLTRGLEGSVYQMVVKEQTENNVDKILTTGNSYIDMENFVSNVGIYFVNAGSMFGEDGFINVINDETDEIIHTFTVDDWNTYTSENPYMYDIPVKHIRIETSEAARASYCAVYNIKEIDDEYIVNNYTEEEFETFRLINSYMTGSVKYAETDELVDVKNDIARANYDLEKSVVTVSSISPSYFTTQETKENVKITLKTQDLVYNTTKWINGEFLVKLPKEILTLDINSVTVSDSSVKILGYSLDEKDDAWYLKILTENTNATTYDLVIDCNFTPDPRIISSEQTITVYAVNENATSYLWETQDIYDVDGDENVSEYIGYATGKITFIGPTSMITMETATEYNENHDRLETTIAPQVAIIDKTQNDKTAVIQASILNNYSSTISEIRLVGKIPFEGNTFQLTNKDLGSNYTTVLTGPIVVPDDIKDYAKIYYSENEIVTEDLEDESNNWIPEEEITDYSNVRCYLIDLGNYVMSKGEEQICEYKIEIPSTVNYNDVAYSTHAVYFSLDTVEGKLRDRTETNKLGFMIARKYNLEINKTKKGTETLIKGATFSITEEGEENKSKILTTTTSGIISVSDLYVDKVYVIKEIKSPYDYVLNSQEIKIKATVNEETGELEVTKLEGETKDDVAVFDRDEGKTVVVNIENEPKFTFKLTKTDTDGNVIKGVRFRIKGKGLASNGRTATTNKDGLITISGLYPGEIYTLVEEYAKGYEYSEEEIQFRVVWNDGILVPEVISGTFSTEPVVDNNQIAQPIMTASLTNTKLREYSLGLTKYEEETTDKLSGATFKITGEWIDEEITTDENGCFEVPTLYENIEYTLEEILAPEGYAVSENVVKFIGTFDDENKLIITVTEGDLVTDRTIIAEKEAKEAAKNNSDSTNSENNVENIIENTVENTIVDTEIENVIENTVTDTTVEETTEENEETEVTNTYGSIVDSTGTVVEDKEVNISLSEEGKLIFTLGFEDEPLFKLTKIDGTTFEPLPNVKFAIKKINDDDSEEDAKDTSGNLIGEEYKIDGVTYRVIETDSKGEITADLPEGIYKVIEVETLKQYELSEDIEERTYYFGIGKNLPAVKELVEKVRIALTSKGTISYCRELVTKDGGYIVVGTLEGRVVFDAERTVANEDIEIIDTAVMGLMVL